MDNLTPLERSERMRRIKSANTRPELRLRKLIFSKGYRYRLHRRDIPGTPDMAFIGARKLIFIHGCFWHQHKNCVHARVPKSNLDYWVPKLLGNAERDERTIRGLRLKGWRVLVVWECELKNLPELENRVSQFLAQM